MKSSVDAKLQMNKKNERIDGGRGGGASTASRDLGTKTHWISRCDEQPMMKMIDLIEIEQCRHLWLQFLHPAPQVVSAEK